MGDDKLKITEELMQEMPFDVRRTIERALRFQGDKLFGSDFERVKLHLTIDGLAARIVDLKQQLSLMTTNRATALNIVEEQRQALRKLPELEEDLRAEREAHKRTQRRLAARERELERIRTTLYKNRVDEFMRVTKGDDDVGG